MTTEHESNEQLTEVERLFARALRVEAARCARGEPPRLAAACRAPRPPRATARRHPWRWAAAAAALALLSLPLRQFQRHLPRREPLDPPASVTPEIDRAALYAALPKIPRPERPPAPLRLTPVLVIRPEAPARPAESVCRPL